MIDLRDVPIDIDDPSLNEVVRNLLDIPPRTYQEFGRQFIDIIMDHISEKPDIPSGEPFGPMIWYQRHVTKKLRKRALHNPHTLDSKLGEISRTPISSRVEVDEMAELAKIVLELREMSTLSAPGAYNQIFFHIVMSFLTAQNSGANQIGGDKVKLIYQCNQIRAEIKYGGKHTVDRFFDSLKERFPAIEESEPIRPQSTLVANTASRPNTSNKKENVSPQIPGTTVPKGDILQLLLYIKAELGTIRALLNRQQLVDPNLPKDDRSKARRTQEELAKKGKQFAAMAKVKKGKKAPKATQGRKTFPRSFVDSSSSSDSEDDDQQETAMFARTSIMIAQPQNLEAIYGPFRRNVVETTKARQTKTNPIGFHSLPPSQVSPEMIEDTELPAWAAVADPYSHWRHPKTGYLPLLFSARILDSRPR
jgi:hypothetical protein